ncbi:hypothetical protein OG21DRAFT_1523288 [Imleria badia]|nr:hypothetical protein OG21DRAFT_1523288 [Imleria badia]
MTREAYPAVKRYPSPRRPAHWASIFEMVVLDSTFPPEACQAETQGTSHERIPESQRCDVRDGETSAEGPAAGIKIPVIARASARNVIRGDLGRDDQVRESNLIGLVFFGGIAAAPCRASNLASLIFPIGNQDFVSLFCMPIGHDSWDLVIPCDCPANKTILPLKRTSSTDKEGLGVTSLYGIPILQAF